MIELLDHPETVNDLVDQQHVLVGGVECVFVHDYQSGSSLVHLQTLSSRQFEYEEEVRRLCKELEEDGADDFVVKAVPDLIYQQYIHHLRKTENGVALMERRHIIEILKSGVYVLA